jgi:hypothetical protein
VTLTTSYLIVMVTFTSWATSGTIRLRGGPGGRVVSIFRSLYTRPGN